MHTFFYTPYSLFYFLLDLVADRFLSIYRVIVIGMT
jgi:hypothetical protein